MIFRKSCARLARDAADAAARQDGNAFVAALQALSKAGPTAAATDLQEALTVLLPVAHKISFGRGAGMAGLLGSLANRGTDPTVALPVLVERAVEVMELAADFLGAYRSLGVEPGQDSPQAATDRLTQARHELGLSEGAPDALIEAFFTCDDWVQPVLFLTQRQDVRQALPQRERLTRAVEATADHVETARWLRGLLRVVDDEPITVLHRATGRGFRVRVSGIGHNYQLQTLLAAHLIGDPADGKLPGRPVTPAEFAAASDGDLQPTGGVIARFAFADAQGHWISEDDGPIDLSPHDGTRLIVLDELPGERGWTSGRAYPLMRPQVTVEGRLPDDEAAAILDRITAPVDLPPGFVLTDDLTLPMAGRSYADLVSFIIERLLAGTDPDVVGQAVSAEFRLSADDAERALDRTCGGLVRAATRNLANRPIQEKDPVAWESFQRGMDDPSIIQPCTGIAA